MKRIRIAGVVKTMNQVRIQWNAGIAPGQADHFIRLVRNTVLGVEEICRAHRLKLDQLPAPTYRAYRYLKSLDLNKLPSPGRANGRPAPLREKSGLRIRNLVSFCRSLQGTFFDYAKNISTQADSLSGLDGQAAAFLDKIHTWINEIEKISRARNISLLELPAPSRRSYLWLKFLSNPQNLERHLLALKTACEMIQKIDPTLAATLKRRSLTVQFEWNSLPAIYKARQENHVYRIAANEGFISAQQQVIQALLRSALRVFNHSSLGPDSSLAIIKDYAQSPDFRVIASAVERGSGIFPIPDPIHTPPNHSNDPRLDVIFDTVNQAYFGGQLPRPHLAWNKTITHRKLGQYNETTDTVLISLTLDHPQVPGYALEFVMYHELLHKKLGIQVKNGRRRAHTRAFRAEERKFRQYDQATAFLNNLGPKFYL